MNGMKETASGSLPKLLDALTETREAEDALMCAYRMKLNSDDSQGSGGRRWRLRTLSALRALCKARRNTEASIAKLRRHMVVRGIG